ncbi:MAG: hypothetical protein ABI051_16285 [Vicinamibacterales bacterium]
MPVGPYTVVKKDTHGISPGYDVRDPRGQLWSVKLGIEAQPEVTASRVLWAIGYHQDPMHYVKTWTMTHSKSDQPPARFRVMPSDEKVVSEWSWRQNPFVGTRPLAGLLVANLILNNWDWKTNNNKVYAERGDAPREPRRYVERDLGASLGRLVYPVLLQRLRLRGFVQGTKSDVDGFEQQGFIKTMTAEHVEFAYRGIHGDLVRTLTPADVRWSCALLARLTEAQWHDAFRAGGYEPEIAARYIRKIQTKIAEGLAAPTTAASVR